jgi:aminotransferase
MTREVMLGVTAVAEQHDLLIISDEIYDRLVYGIEHVCVPALPGMRERTVLLGGFSKDYAMTGWRIGYACAPAEILTAMRKVHQYTIMSAPTTGQAAALVALTDDGNRYVEEMRQEYNRRRRLIVDGFNTLGMDCFEPRGAFYAFPSIAKTGMSSDDFAMRLLDEEEVAMVPGDAFGASGAGFVRASYATAYEKIEEALNRLERFMRQHG